MKNDFQIKFCDFFSKNKLEVFFVFFVLIISLLPYLLFGENCLIEDHDNLDSNIPLYKYIRDNGLFFALNKPTGILNNISSVYFSTMTQGDLTLQTILYYLFPTFTAYSINIVIGTFVGFISSYYVLKKIAGISDGISLATASLFSILPCFPGYKLAINSVPIFFLILFWIKNKEIKKAVFFSILLPFLSSFSATGIFICGFFYLLFVIDFIKEKKINYLLFVCLTFFTIFSLVVNYKLFYMRLFIHDELNRDYFTPPDYPFLQTFITYFFCGNYAASSLHTFVIISTVILAIIICFKNHCKELLNIIYLGLLINLVFSLIIVLDLNGIVAFVFSKICPPLRGLQFARLFCFTRFIWYLLWGLSLTYLQKNIKYSKIFIYVIFIFQFFIISDPRNSYSDSLRSWKANITGSSSISYKEYYDENFFSQVKENIDYKNENVCAFGFHPAILLYNGFNTFDGYVNTYPYKDMVGFRKIIEPELALNEDEKFYFDSWGGRRYLYSSELNYEKTRNKDTNSVKLNINKEAFNNAKIYYIFSRAEINNAEILHLSLEKVIESKEGIYKLYIYKNVDLLNL